jgi:hypothetical protein
MLERKEDDEHQKGQVQRVTACGESLALLPLVSDVSLTVVGDAPVIPLN